MFEKVNPGHPDKVADRIAGAIVDHCYAQSEGGWLKSNPRVAVEVLLGHGKCYVMIETSCTRAELSCNDVDGIVHRIVGDVEVFVTICGQDPELSKNQRDGIRVGDNGIFRGCPVTEEQKVLTAIAASIYERWPYDGKFIINDKTHDYYNDTNDFAHMLLFGHHMPKSYELTICQSNAEERDIVDFLNDWDDKHGLDQNWAGLPILTGWDINPLGYWTGGPDVDCGATNRKLGSDMGDGVTGGGLHGKDLSKADVSVNIVCFLLAQRYGTWIEACCSIGDEDVTFNGYYGVEAFDKGLERLPITMSYADVVEQARLYIHTLGGFERFAEWGLIRPKDV